MGSAGTFTCTGVAGSDTSVTVTGAANEDVVVTSSADFGISVASGDALQIIAGTFTGASSVVVNSLDVRLTGSGTISAAAGHGLVISHQGRSDTYIDIQQNITAGRDGVDITTGGLTGDATIKLRDVTSGTDGTRVSPGVMIEHIGHTLVAEVGSVIGDSVGVEIQHSGGGNVQGVQETHPLTVTINGSIRSGADPNASNMDATITGKEGLLIRAASGVSNITATTNGSITTQNGGHGIRIQQQGEDIDLDANGAIDANGKGIYITTVAASNDVDITATASVAGMVDAIDVQHLGEGNVVIRAEEMLDSDNGKGINVSTASATTGYVDITTSAGIQAQTEGILIDHDGIGRVDITTSGTVTSTAEEGIFVSTASDTMGDVRITANGNIMAGKEGIYLQHNGSGDVHIATSGDVTPTSGEEGIVVVANSASTGDVTIDINSDVVVDSDRTTNSAVFANNGSGTTRINISEGTVASSSGTAIDVIGAADAIVTLNDGASLNADFDASNSFDGTATLVLAGVDTTGDNSFQLNHVLSVDNLEKNGTGTWTLAGEQDSGESFTNFDINEGRIVWDATSALVATSVSIADGAALEISDSQAWSTSLTLSGVLDLVGSDSNLTLDTLAGSGGSVDIEIDFSNGDGDLGTPRLNVTTVSGGPIIINVVAMGGFPEIPEDDEDEAITIGNLISTTNAEDGDFVAGRSRNGNFDFDFFYDAANNRWDLIVQEAGGNIEGALFETLPATLSQLASLESYQQRLQGRAFVRGDNRIYGKVSRSSSDVEPNSTNLATYDIDNTSVRFGVELPLRINHPRIADNFTVGANIDFGQATTDVSVEDNRGKISTDSITAGINATWQSDDGVYLDGQLQYATSKNDIKTDIKLGSTDVAAYTLGAEIGWGLDFEGFFVMPSAQIAWTEVDLEDFTSAAGDVMTIDDGNVLNGRIGVAVEREWRGILPEDVLLRGHADLLAPLEGEVIANVDGMKMLSERKEPSVNIGIGASYAWNRLGISADVSTQQGGETEGYAGTLGFKYEF